MFLGFFALLNANGDEGKKAKLISPLFEKSDDVFCFHFWFSASGPNIGTLSILKTKAADINVSETIWSWKTDSSNPVSEQWTEAQVEYQVELKCLTGYTDLCFTTSEYLYQLI